ncbi:hypothetical protein [Sessilibacter corallicola]|uniref:hypothetical protein n=1 Tax=Sessilibacter corallicola TaxID=2904075 RepID=UPI001E42D515|nr:hypothetical protein [Sessilibacter corallicola]MCE2029037.1 hypothetical protein [Sessilibacter corallicola]
MIFNIRKSAKKIKTSFLYFIYAATTVLAITSTVNAKGLLVEKNYLIEDPHIRIDLSDLIKQSKSAYSGKIAIIAPNNIKFLATLKTLPEEKQSSYIYTALSVMNIAPNTEINYQAFVSTPAGTEKQEVIAVYLTNSLAEKIKKTDLSVFRNTTHTWHGYHIYDYSKGPAIVVENVDIDNRENTL